MLPNEDLLDEATFAEEFPQVQSQVYLDHAGTTLFAKSQISCLTDDLFPLAAGKILGNPHSHNPSSRYTADIVEQVRMRILQFFNTTADHYDVIFTSGATAAIKLVVGAFDFSSSSDQSSGTFVYTQENHTSVFGARGIAFERGANVFCIDADDLLAPYPSSVSQESVENGCQRRDGHGLFAYPAQCNFSGRKFPLEWTSEIQSSGTFTRKLESLLTKNTNVFCDGKPNSASNQNQHTLPKEWFVLLDAASFVPTNPLNLSIVRPDFVCVSFYKIFGFPTGIGALLVKTTSGEKMLTRKQYFGGGTVAVSLTRRDFVKFKLDLHDRFEDGTISFLSIIGLLRGFDTLTRLGVNMILIRNHVSFLVQSAYRGLSQLRHRDGSPVVELYGVSDASFPPTSITTSTHSSATISSNKSAAPDDLQTRLRGRAAHNADGAGVGGVGDSSVEGDDIDSASLNGNNHGSALAFNVLRPGGAYVGFSEVSKILELFDIHVRTGCFCNPGACQKWLRMTDEQIVANHQAGHVCGDDLDLIDGQPTGCVRISFGYMSRHRDVDKFLKVMRECFVHSSATTQKTNEDRSKIDDDECRVTDLLVYPVKSCGAFKPESSWPVTDSGFAYDRTWMITDGRGVVLSQKRESRLCFLLPRIDVQKGLLWLHVDGLEDVSVPLDPSVENGLGTSSASICTSKVCGDRVDVLDCGDLVSDWLSDALCRNDNPRLLRINPHFQRLSKKAQKGVASSATKLSLANEAQFLLISRVSVRALINDLKIRREQSPDADEVCEDGLDELDEEELISRFRPNVVVDGGLSAYEEEQILEFCFEHENSQSSLILQNVGPCSRCQMICIDQKTGEKTKEPLVTLAAIRGPKIPFGVHCCRSPSDEEDKNGTKMLLSVSSVVKLTKQT